MNKSILLVLILTIVSLLSSPGFAKLVNGFDLAKEIPGAEFKKAGNKYVFCKEDLCIPFNQTGERRYHIKGELVLIEESFVRDAFSKIKKLNVSLPNDDFTNVITGKKESLKKFYGKKFIIFCWASW